MGASSRATAKIPLRSGVDTAATRDAGNLALEMRRTPDLGRYEPLHHAYLLMLRHHDARRSSDARPLGPSGAGADPRPLGPSSVGADALRFASSLRAIVSARGLAPEACRLTVRGTDPEGLVVVDVESEGRSLSLRLRPGGYEVVRGAEASPPVG